MEYPFGVLTGRSERGIPQVRFIEDVAEFMKQPDATTKSVIEVLQQVHGELGKIEGRLGRLRTQVLEAIPEIKENLEVVEFTRKKQDEDEPIRTNFQVSASLFAEADLDQKQGVVVLWLGANTAVELKFDEATKLLVDNLEKKEKHLATINEDLKLVKVQITTTEVSIARVYNNDVKERRKEKTDESS